MILLKILLCILAFALLVAAIGGTAFILANEADEIEHEEP